MGNFAKLHKLDLNRNGVLFKIFLEYIKNICAHNQSPVI